ncbi:MAG: hypothetical protein JWO89_1411, partial [Verrucomicrobiaceae bacterium]|nr:hypothetical protein [Verrucomicrobiaceae bacterium]
TPSEAFNCLQATDMDVRGVENFVMRKTSQRALTEAEKQKYVQSFQLD